MSYYPEHNPGDHEDPLAGPTWTVGVVGAVLFAVTVLGVAALTYSVMDQERDTKLAETVAGDALPVVETLRLAQTSRLSGGPRLEIRPENPDGEMSIVIPVETAIDHFLAETASTN